jgi:CRISPR-associated protein Cas5d
MTNGPPLEVVVWGDYACFTRPEMKVERVSYSVMTPSAARGILEAIFWKPEVVWQVREIHVLKPVRWFSIKRNEVSSRMSYRSDKELATWAGYFADDDRTQRATLCLRKVKYLIKADLLLKKHATDDVAKYRDQFQRRVEHGACFVRPVLGCREFAADFAARNGNCRFEWEPADEEDLGRMLLDVDFDPDPATGGWSEPCPGTGTPVFFQAKLTKGVLHVDPREYAQFRWTREVKP